MKSKLINYLPAIFQTDAKGADPDFTDRFLKAFESVLFGNDDPDLSVKGIEKIIEQVHDYFDPDKTPASFLPWLAGWVALTLKEEVEWYGVEDTDDRNDDNIQLAPLNESERRPTRNRNLISEIVQLYFKRGTITGLESYLKIYVDDLTVDAPAIDDLDSTVSTHIKEFTERFQVGVTSTVGENTVVDEGRPHYFHVYMELKIPDWNKLIEKRKALHEIITKEKPAHTYYGLTIKVPTMQVGVNSTVGSDTMLGGFISS